MTLIGMQIASLIELIKDFFFNWANDITQNFHVKL